jgi:hypothetical protein
MLIGSKALEIRAGKKLRQTKSDWDLIIWSDQESLAREVYSIPKDDVVEIHRPDFLNNKDFLTKDVILEDKPVATVMQLAILKRSHLWRTHKWDRHIADYHKVILPMLAENIDVSHQEADQCVLDNYVYQTRFKLTKQEFRASNPKLTKSNDDFFTDRVVKKYDHDWLHEIVAVGENPIYTQLKYEGKEDIAWCEKDLWDKLDQKTKLTCVWEETCVITLERFLIPEGIGFSPRLTYYSALKKVCTTLSSGWFRDFAIQNFHELMQMQSDSETISHIHKIEQAESNKTAKYYGETK